MANRQGYWHSPYRYSLFAIRYSLSLVHLNPHDRPAQARARFRLAAPPRAAQPGGHRARPAAAGRHRRDPDEGGAAARLCDAARARQGARRRSRRCAAPTSCAAPSSSRPIPWWRSAAASCPRRNCSTRRRNACGSCRAAIIGSIPASASSRPRSRSASGWWRRGCASSGCRRSDLEAYLASGEWRGKAGGYAIQGLAGTFVVKIVGSYTNVVGLPLYETTALLAGEGYPVHFGWLNAV